MYIPILNKLQILYHPIRNCLIFIFQSLGTWLMIWKYFKHIDNNIILNFPKPSNSQLLFNTLFGTLLAFFFIQFCIIIGFKETAKIPNIFVRNMMCIYQEILFSVIIIDPKTLFQMWFPVLSLRPLDLFISYTMVVNFCQFPLTLSCNLCIHLFFNTCN